jgi:hypothetical protein
LKVEIYQEGGSKYGLVLELDEQSLKKKAGDIYTPLEI